MLGSQERHNEWTLTALITRNRSHNKMDAIITRGEKNQRAHIIVTQCRRHCLLAYLRLKNPYRRKTRRENKRRTPEAALIRGIPYNLEKHYKTILKQHRHLFSLDVMFFSSKWPYFSALAGSSLFRILVIPSSDYHETRGFFFTPWISLAILDLL